MSERDLSSSETVSDLVLPIELTVEQLTALTQSGVLLRTIDPIDHRRVNLELSADTEDQLIELLAC